MTRCTAVTVTVNGAEETIRARVADGFGSEQDRAAFASVISAARRHMAAASHPDHKAVRCPRCGAATGQDCATRGGRSLLPWGHLERHAAAIAADGRTCAGGAEAAARSETP